jgi:Kef-type K+ transport system membrane component KefB
LAGLFFREEVASKQLVQKVEDRLYGIAYLFLGPIFFISLGFHITFQAFTLQGLLLLGSLVVGVIVIQVASAGLMAKAARFSTIESFTIGIGMTGRAEMAFILAAIGQKLQILDDNLFSIIVFSTFLLNFFASFGLKYCANIIEKRNPSNLN